MTHAYYKQTEDIYVPSTVSLQTVESPQTSHENLALFISFLT